MGHVYFIFWHFEFFIFCICLPHFVYIVFLKIPLIIRFLQSILCHLTYNCFNPAWSILKITKYPRLMIYLSFFVQNQMIGLNTSTHWLDVCKIHSSSVPKDGLLKLKIKMEETVKDLGQVGRRPPIPTRFIFKLNKCHRCSISRIFNYNLNLKSIAVVLITTAMREYLQEPKIVKYLLMVTGHTSRSVNVTYISLCPVIPHLVMGYTISGLG